MKMFDEYLSTCQHWVFQDLTSFVIHWNLVSGWMQPMLKFSLDRIGLREDDSTLRSVEFKLVVERISSAVGHLYCIICGLNNSKFTHCTLHKLKRSWLIKHASSLFILKITWIALVSEPENVFPQIKRSLEKSLERQ